MKEFYTKEIKNKHFLINHNTKQFKCNQKVFTHGGTVIRSDNHQINCIPHDVHTLIYGETGSMKTRRIGMSTLISIIKAGENFVINDCKKEYYPLVSGELKTQGYQTLVIDLRNPNSGNRYNPFDLAIKAYKENDIARSDNVIKDIAKNVFADSLKNTKESYWSNVSSDYFEGLALFIRDYYHPDALTFENIRLLHEKTKDREFKSLLEKLPKESSCYSHLASTVRLTARDTQSCIHSNFTQNLNIYLDENMRDLMSVSEIDFSKISQTKTAIFIISTDEKSTYNSIISMITKQIYEELIHQASKEMLGHLNIRFNFFLDEFCNLPCIHDFNNMISAARSRNIRFFLFIQSYAQLMEHYGINNAKNIFNNCAIKVYLKSSEIQFIKEYICDSSPIRELRYSHKLKNMFTPDDIFTLSKEKGEAIINLDGEMFKSQLKDISELNFNIKTEIIPIPKRVYFQRDIIDIKIVKENVNKMNQPLLDEKAVLISQLESLKSLKNVVLTEEKSEFIKNKNIKTIDKEIMEIQAKIDAIDLMGGYDLW